VVAWDQGADDERLLRADRVRSVRETGSIFEPRELQGAGRPLYDPPAGGDAILVELLLHSEARWIAEYYILESEAEGADGDLRIGLRTTDLAWVVLLLLRVGTGAEVIGPPELTDLTRTIAAQTLSAYR
jgi:proteasome accessory factor C